MEFIKELLSLAEAKTPTSVKRATAATAGAKALNDALMTKRGGGHYAAKKDYVRAKEKQKMRRAVDESTE